MNRENYINASARTWVLEKSLLNASQYERLIEAADVEEVFRLLSDTPYGEALLRLEKPQDYEVALLEAQDHFYKELLEMSPDKELIDFFLAKYDYHNYKILFKELLTKEEHQDLYFSYDSLGLLEKRDALLPAEEVTLQRELPSFYWDVKEAYEKHEDPQVVDILVDKAYYEKLHEILKSLESPFLEQYLSDEIDFINLKMLFRMKKQMKNVTLIDSFLIEGGHIDKAFFTESFFSPVDEILQKLGKKTMGKTMDRALKTYEDTQKLSSMEKVFEEHALLLSEEAGKVTYGPEVLFNYLLRLETEIKNLRMIIVSKLNKVSPEKLRERLRRIHA